MCGILGQVNNEDRVTPSLFKDMLKTLLHRGPDGSHSVFLSEGSVALGHQRLSIIDLSENGTQPMSNEDGSIWLTFNGEIYNFKELRRILQAKGHRFRSKTDAEVIIHGYEQWGADCVGWLRGMFAFGIWDGRKRQILLARDPFGIKPLYYYQDANQFIFASEVKAIVSSPHVPREININALCDFFYYRYIPSPKSIWRNIFKLPPASILIHHDGRNTISKYWQPSLQIRSTSEQEALIKLDELLNESVQLHLISDVPLGLLLSGGVDSSTLAYYMHRQGKSSVAFGIGFDVDDDWYNELPEARLVADKYCKELREEIVKPDVWELLPKLMWFYDEPFGDGSMIPTYIVSKLARKYMKVALSGDGGDELFAGYNRYFRNSNATSVRPFFSRLLASLRKTEKKKDTVAYLGGMHPFFEKGDLAQLLHTDYRYEIQQDQEWFLDQHYNADVPNPKRWQLLDLLTILPEQYLTKVDRASMANSLEIRVPFLDKRLVECMLALPVDVYLHEKKHKYLLKKLMMGKLPAKVLQKRKRGFSMPLKDFWNVEKLLEYVLSGPSVQSALFQRDYVYKLAQQQETVALHRLWQLTLFDACYRIWGKSSKRSI